MSNIINERPQGIVGRQGHALLRLLRRAVPLAAAIATAAVAVPALADPVTELPAVTVPGRQIGWTHDVMTAFTEALETNRPLVLLFGARDGSNPLLDATARTVLPCPQLNQLAGLAVFAVALPQEDEFAHRIAAHLRLTEFPTVTVIAPRSDVLTELHRMEGFFNAADIAADLRQLLAPYAPAGFIEGLRPLPQSAFAYPNLACNAASERRLREAGRLPAP
jgi:hypothetical protein